MRYSDRSISAAAVTDRIGIEPASEASPASGTVADYTLGADYLRINKQQL
jgi:hypothetical protein